MSKNFLSELTGSFATPALENPTGVMMEAAYRDLGYGLALHQLRNPT